MDKTILITHEWLHAHGTPGGGWTAQQLAVFDIAWPPSKGWLKGLVGQHMTAGQREAFERLYNARQEFRRAMGRRGPVVAAGGQPAGVTVHVHVHLDGKDGRRG